MAQVRKYQGGGTTNTQPVILTATLPIVNNGKINNVDPTKYFYVGDSAYDLLKYKDMVWHNFDRWIEHNKYDSSIKDKSRKFINEVLDLLTTGDAKFNPDLTLTVKDNVNNWDPRVGFNKVGPKLFNWLTSDKVDDQRGIPHVSMRLLVEVLRSPYMEKFKKPDEVALADLTGKVFDKLVERDFGNSWVKYRSTWGMYSDKEKVRMFRDALKDFKNNTDFSIYTQSSLKELGPQIDKFLLYLDTNPTLDDKFLDKATESGFYGMKQWMQYSPPRKNDNAGGEKKSDAGNAAADAGTKVDNNRVPVSSGIRALSLGDISKVIAPEVKNLIDFYVNNNKKTSFISTLNQGLYALTGKKVKDLDVLLRPVGDNGAYSYVKARQTHGDGVDKKIDERTMYINRALMGQHSPYTGDNLYQLIKLVINKASNKGQLTPFRYDIPEELNQFAFIETSYDPQTKTYLAIDKVNKTIFVVPEIFKRNSNFWNTLKNNVNTYLQNNLQGTKDSRQYSAGDIYELGMMSYFNDKVPVGTLRSMLETLAWDLYPKHKLGGILKAMTGAQFLGLSNTPVNLAQSIREETERKRQLIVKERTAARNLKKSTDDVISAYEESDKILADEIAKLDFIDRQKAEINSWLDLKNNLDEHDGWVVGTLISDLIAFGGSLSGGAFNPVADAATVASMVGTIGSLATDKQMSTLEKIGYGAFNIALDVASLAPEIGAIPKAAKIGNTARKAAPILLKFIRYGALGLTGSHAYEPLKKLYKGESLTKEDWTNLAYFALALLMGTLAKKAAKGGRKYTKAIEGSTSYKLRTGKDTWVKVNKGVYDKYKGMNVKDLRQNKNDKPLFKTTDGQKIYAKDFNKGFFGNKKIEGKVDEISAGYRLMTPKEVSEELGLKPYSVNGELHYPVPRSYNRVKYRMETTLNTTLREGATANPFKTVNVPLISKRGEMILKANGEPVMVNVSYKKAQEMSLLHEKYIAKTENPKLASKTSGDKATSTSGEGAVKKPVEEKSGGEKPGEGTGSGKGTGAEETKTGAGTAGSGSGTGETAGTGGGTPKNEGAAASGELGTPKKTPSPKKNAKMTPEVLQSIKSNLNNLGRTSANIKKVKLLLAQSRNRKPLPELKKGYAYHYSPKYKDYLGTTYKNLKTKRELNKKLNKRAIKFLGGGITPSKMTLPTLKLNFPTLTLPSWFLKKYPDALLYKGDGDPVKFGVTLPKTLDTYDFNLDLKKAFGELNLNNNSTLSETKPKDIFTYVPGKGYTINTASRIGNLKSFSDDPNYKSISSSTTYDAEDPKNKKEGFFDKLGRVISGHLLPHHVLGIAEGALAIQTAKKTLELKDLAILPATEFVDNVISYSPTFAMSNEAYINLLMGKNNTTAAKNVSSNLRDYYANIYANNLTNASLALENLKAKATEFLTNQTNILNAYNTLRAKLNATANSNYLKAIAARAGKYTNAEEFNTAKNQYIANVMDMFLREYASREEARNTLGQHALKAYYEGFSDEYANVKNAIKAQDEAKKRFIEQYTNEEANKGNTNIPTLQIERAWENSLEYATTLAEIDKYRKLFEVNWYDLLMKGTNPGYPNYLLSQIQNITDRFSVQPLELKGGGSLSYELRMSLKQQDAMNKMITTDKRERSSVRRELIKEYNKNMRLINKRSEMLLKAAMGIK